MTQDDRPGRPGIEVDGDASPRPADERIARTMTFQFLVAMNQLSRSFAARFGGRLQISLPEWRCTMALAAEPGASGEDVARRMSMDKMAVSRALRRLETQGRAARETDPRSRRRQRWWLTEEGWAVFDEIVPTALARDEMVFGDLTEREHARIREMLERLRGA